MLKKTTHIEALLRDSIQRVAVGPNRGKNIAAEDLTQIVQAMFEAEADPVMAAVLLIGLRMKGETIEELKGALKGLQQSVVSHCVAVDDLLQLSEAFDGYVRYSPISAFVPSILACCGVNAVLIGVESVGPKYGLTAHQILKAAGFNVRASSQKAGEQIELNGWAYLDQRSFSPRADKLGVLRDKIVKRTAITTVEKLQMPLRARGKTHLALGFVHQAYRSIYSQLAGAAGFDSLCLIKGVEGGISPALNKPVRALQFNFPRSGDLEAKEFELPSSLSDQIAMQQPLVPRDAQSQEEFINQTAAACLRDGLGALQGEHNLARKSMLVTASTILFKSGREKSFASAVEKVRDCLDNGSALQRFMSLQRG